MSIVNQGRLLRFLPSCTRCLHSSSSLQKQKAGRIKVSKGEKPITYEQANFPYQIGVRKGWNSWNTSNLKDEDGASERAVEDMFIRKFIYGTFHGYLATEIIIKRRANQVIVSLILTKMFSTNRIYFLTGYSEELLSHWLKSPVKLEIQVVTERPIYKWI